MRRFIPISNVSNANLLSKRLFELSRPSGVPCVDCRTTKLLRWVVHPVSKAVMMDIPDGMDFPVHQVADGNTIRPLLQPFIAAGQVAAQEVDSLVALVQSSAGTRLEVWSIIPTFWKGLSKTAQELKLEGWFPEPSDA